MTSRLHTDNLRLNHTSMKNGGQVSMTSHGWNKNIHTKPNMTHNCIHSQQGQYRCVWNSLSNGRQGQTASLKCDYIPWPKKKFHTKWLIVSDYLHEHLKSGHKNNKLVDQAVNWYILYERSKCVGMCQCCDSVAWSPAEEVCELQLIRRGLDAETTLALDTLPMRRPNHSISSKDLGVSRPHDLHGCVSTETICVG